MNKEPDYGRTFRRLTEPESWSNPKSNIDPEN